MQYTQEELNKILEKHKRWLKGEPGGEKADLEFADLAGADLRWVNLSGANLTETDLTSVNLRSANLRSANLSEANLTEADLRWAELKLADLTNTNLDNAKLNWVNTEEITGYTVYCVQMPTSRKNARLSYWKELNIWTTGCFQGTREELIKNINETHKDNEKIRNRYFKAIAFIETLASEEW